MASNRQPATTIAFPRKWRSIDLNHCFLSIGWGVPRENQYISISLSVHVLYPLMSISMFLKLQNYSFSPLKNKNYIRRNPLRRSFAGVVDIPTVFIVSTSIVLPLSNTLDTHPGSVIPCLKIEYPQFEWSIIMCRTKIAMCMASQFATLHQTLGSNVYMCIYVDR